MGGGGLNGISIKKREREGQSLSQAKGSVLRTTGQRADQHAARKMLAGRVGKGAVSQGGGGIRSS